MKDQILRTLPQKMIQLHNFWGSFGSSIYIIDSRIQELSSRDMEEIREFYNILMNLTWKIDGVG